MLSSQFRERIANLSESRSNDRKIAPYYPSSHEVVERMLDAVGLCESDVLYDIGSGDGRILVQACQRGVQRAVGIEIEPSLVKASQENLASHPECKDRTEILACDFADVDFSPATVITVYMGPAGTWDSQKYLVGVDPSVRIVSHDYAFKNWTPRQTIQGTHFYPSADGASNQQEAGYEIFVYSTEDIKK